MSPPTRQCRYEYGRYSNDFIISTDKGFSFAIQVKSSVMTYVSRKRPRHPPSTVAVFFLAALLSLMLVQFQAFVVQIPTPPAKREVKPHSLATLPSVPTSPPALLKMADAGRRVLSPPPFCFLLPYLVSAITIISPGPAVAVPLVLRPVTMASTAVKTPAANLPPDVIATALLSLDKTANLARALSSAPTQMPSTISDTVSSTSAGSAESSPVASTSSPALYVTARVGARGRVLASVKIPVPPSSPPAFPLEVHLKEGDIYADTPQARHDLAQAIRSSDLVLSARLDSDGRASTRDPRDLVGQGVVYKFQSVDSAQWSRADISLTGRGAFGEFVTGGKVR